MTQPKHLNSTSELSLVQRIQTVELDVFHNVMHGISLLETQAELCFVAFNVNKTGI